MCLSLSTKVQIFAMTMKGRGEQSSVEESLSKRGSTTHTWDLVLLFLKFASPFLLLHGLPEMPHNWAMLLRSPLGCIIAKVQVSEQ